MSRLHFFRRSLVFKFATFLAYILAVTSSADAQTAPSGQGNDQAPVQPVHTFGKPVFLYDTFAFDSGQPDLTRVDLYLGFVNDLLQFVKEDEERYRARYEVSVDFLDDERNQIDGRSWRGQVLAQSFPETNSRRQLHLTSAHFDLPPGTYRLRLEFVDLDTKNHLQREREITVPDFSDRNLLKVSDVVFVDSVLTAADGSRQIAPNLNRNRDDPESRFAAYFEIYPAAGSDSVWVTCRLLDWRKSPLDGWDLRFASGNSRISQIVDLGERLDKPGRYQLDVVIRQGGQQLTRRQSFFISRTGNEEDSFEFSIEEMTLEPLRYILSEAEYEEMARAPEEQRRQMLLEFWQDRDPDPTTPVNELMEEFYRRVHFANEHFAVTAGNKQGWETDRGRIYIIYGQPTEVRQHRLDMNKPPLEVWYYLRDDHRFIFQDKHGTGDYVLIHER